MRNWKPPVWRKEKDTFVQDYNDYSFSLQEWARVLAEGIFILGLIGHCFYDSYVASIFLTPGFVIYVKYKKQQYMEKRKHSLKLQFKDAVLAVSANQKAGYSVENAFREAYVDMKLLYGENSLICKELMYLIRGIQNNITIERLLLSLGNRSRIGDIQEFGEVFSIAKRNGGNLSKVIDMTAATIEEKMNVEQEIQVFIAAKKMEANIMSVIPFLIILYMDATSAGFFDVLYHNFLGIIIMSVCLVVYVLSFLLMRKIMRIQV